MSKDLVGEMFPSARACLEQRIGCRAVLSAQWQWRLYWSEGGAELTLYQPDEGPQEARDVDEAIEWVGGDQPCRLNPGTVKYLLNLSEVERERILDAIRHPKGASKPVSSAQFYDEGQDLDIEVTPGGSVVLVVNLETTMENGASVEITAAMMEQLVAAWQRKGE